MINLTLEEYTSLLWQANRSSIINEQFCLVSKDQAQKIMSQNDWKSHCMLVELDQEEINQLKTMNFLRGNVNKGDFLKLFKLDIWLTVKLEQEHRLKLRSNTEELINRERRVNDAIGKLVQINKIEYKVARTLLFDYILKGAMNGLAKLLEIEDLVGKDIPSNLKD